MVDWLKRIDGLQPFAQNPNPYMSIAVRTSNDSLHMAGAIHDQVAKLDREAAFGRVRLMDDLLFESVGRARFRTMLLLAFAGLALLPAIIGITLGIIGALALTHTMTRLLFGVTPTDPSTFLAVALILTTAALIACWFPAWRATRVDPLVALRRDEEAGLTIQVVERSNAGREFEILLAQESAMGGAAAAAIADNESIRPSGAPETVVTNALLIQFLGPQPCPRCARQRGGGRMLHVISVLEPAGTRLDFYECDRNSSHHLALRRTRGESVEGFPSTRLVLCDRQ
jgi:hypothetical protein